MGLHFIAFVIVSSIPGIICAPKLEVTPDRVLSIFKNMEEACQRNNTQILCVMAMASDEINNDGFFPTDRIQHIPNTQRNRLNNVDIPKAYGRWLHGEIRALRLENNIQTSIDTLSQESQVVIGNLPFVFVYSYYIPCADVDNVYYSCAEELAAHARLNEQNFNMLVGYSVKFIYTNLTMAIGYLKQRGIYAIVDLQNDDVDLATNRRDLQEPNTDVFQKKLHICIKDEIKLCNCDALDKYDIVRQKIDALVKNCTSTPDITNERGPITHLGMWLFFSCFKENGWLKLCRETQDNENYEVGQCFIDILEKNYGDPLTQMMLGVPKAEGSYWEAGELFTKWGDMYKNYQPHDNIPMIHKLNRTRERLQIQNSKNNVQRERNTLLNELNQAKAKARKRPGGGGPSDCT